MKMLSKCRCCYPSPLLVFKAQCRACCANFLLFVRLQRHQSPATLLECETQKELSANCEKITLTHQQDPPAPLNLDSILKSNRCLVRNLHHLAVGPKAGASDSQIKDCVTCMSSASGHERGMGDENKN